MDEQKYTLMHRERPVCEVTIEPISGAMLRVSKPEQPELLPLGGNIDTAMLRKWWQRRAVPVNQGRIRRILEQLGIATTQGYLAKNLGLSLSDHYWIRPYGLELSWQQINLFDNDFQDPVGIMQMDDSAPIVRQELRLSPSSSLQGELKKRWVISDGKRQLIKGNHGSTSQESLNEVVATLLHEKQGLQPYVRYSAIQLNENEPLCCVCDCFTSSQVELIPAIDVVESRKKDNATSQYEHFIKVCSEHGQDEAEVRSFLEYQILADFVLTNTDRHLGNFGVLRDAETLQFIGMAPIFDSGNSMFWNNPRLSAQAGNTDFVVNSFLKSERRLLSLVQNPNGLAIEKLPAKDELREIYAADPLIPMTESILGAYCKKLELLDAFQHSRTKKVFRGSER